MKPIPEEILWKVLEYLPMQRIYELRVVSPVWNKICSTILEKRSCLMFNSCREIGGFLVRMPHQMAFGTYPQIAFFKSDINMIVSEGVIAPSIAVVMERFSNFCHAMRDFNTAWGHVVKHWDCDLQLQHVGVSGLGLFRETVRHLLNYFQHLEHLKLKLPLVYLTRDVANDMLIEWPSRNGLKSLSLYICNYAGSYQGDPNEYVPVLESIVGYLLSVTTQLATLEILSDEHSQGFGVGGIVANARSLSMTLTTLILTTVVSNNELAHFSMFAKLQKVQFYVDCRELVPTTLGNFLSGCRASLKDFIIRFLHKNASIIENPLKIFPPNNEFGHPVHLLRLQYLTLWEYGDGVVKMVLLPNLMKLSFYQTSNLKIARGSFDGIAYAPLNNHSLQKSPLLSASGLRDLYMYEYFQQTLRDDEVPALLLTSLLTTVEFENCDFSSRAQLLCKVFVNCTSLEHLTITGCKGLEISDATLLGETTPRALPHAFVRNLMTGDVQRQDANAYDTSNINREQISNLKALRSLVIKGVSPFSPITDKSVFFGLSHCAALTQIHLQLPTEFTEKSRRMLQLMLPGLKLSKLTFL